MIKVYIFFDFNSPTENTDATTGWKFNMIEVILVDKPSWWWAETEDIKAKKDEIGGQSFKSSSL